MKKITMNDIRKQDYYYNEAIKTLCANVQFSGKDIKTILLTSCFPNEGKSDIAFSLSKELGEIGKKALLLDADIRKSAYMTRFKVDQKVAGLSEFLSGQVGVQDVLYATNFPGMHVIFAGRTAPNPSGLLGSETYADLVKELRDFYDYIVIDTPPIGTVIDAAIVAEHADGAILIVESEAVSYKTAQKAMAQIQMTGCQIIGGVLNKV
ncbi:MAG: CpsD/CapB family tyrosine-protein kinase, partial [Blautia sp.]|nr:CpsD/CapB family tyrosine-protein kinase [Blautia sp.]